MSDIERDLEALAAKVNALSPADRLRLAAELLEARRPQLAYDIVDRVKVELGAALAMRMRPHE